ncbi:MULTISPECIES: hypothetical protein [unclassified Streptomyces]|uniref:hypothetical protein n=1 Tax=unclassified Streptomyces TaxID=2593676 RepID=UPI00224E6DE8|nr:MULTISPECIES: hypothetical protein [unclassified Streptomyces]MCX4526218.1 hypothetical protein [Streptomyces sp. NBC_01551]MCX4543217.1 hypothetical protein [Streptomyces sp. NBC_01565]
MRSRTVVTTAIGTTALLALTGCLPGGDKAAVLGKAARASAGATAPAPSASPSAPASGKLADLSGREILSQAYEATRKAESAHVVATVRMDGKPMAIDLSLDKKGNCKGVIRLDGMGKMDLIKSEDLLHFKGDEAYWRGAAKLKHAPKKQTDQMVAALADRWVKVSTSDPQASSMAGMCDLDKLTRDTGRNSLLARKGATATVDGKPTVMVTSPVKEGTETDYVATEGTPYILKSTLSGDQEGEVAFSEFGKPVDVTSPKDSDVLDMGKVRGGGPGEAV